MNDIKKEIKSWIDNCEECEKRYVSNKNYGDALYVRGISYAYKRVLKLIEEQEKHNDFSWDNVNIGDKCINDNYTGTVSRLIFDGDGYCCGMVVNFSDEFGNKWKDVSQDDEYKLYKQIGAWMNNG